MNDKQLMLQSKKALIKMIRLEQQNMVNLDKNFQKQLLVAQSEKFGIIMERDVLSGRIKDKDVEIENLKTENTVRYGLVEFHRGRAEALQGVVTTIAEEQ